MGFRALILTVLVSSFGDLCDGREVVYGKEGGEVTLKPAVDQPISSITWKNGLNKAAEWETGQSIADYYTVCNSGSRCQLNTATGELKIMHLILNEKLDFSPEINGKAAQSSFTVIALKPVSKPSVRKPCNDTYCTLVCEGEDTTYAKYSWKENNKTIANDTTILHIRKRDKLDKIYTCVFSNPVSTVESDPVKEVDLFPGGPSGGIITGVVLTICGAAVACGIGIGLYYKKKVKAKTSGNHKDTKSTTDNLLKDNHEIIEVSDNKDAPGEVETKP